MTSNTTDLDLHPREEKVMFHSAIEAQSSSVDERVGERHDVDGHDEGVSAANNLQGRL